MRCNSGEDERTGTFFGCVWLDTATKVQGYSATPSGVCARRQTISAFEPSFCFVLPSPILDKIPANVENSQMSQICNLYRALFRRSANIYVSKLRLAVCVSFIGLRLTKTSLTLINRTRIRTKGQSAGYPQAQIYCRLARTNP